MSDAATERALFARLLSPAWVNALDPAGPSAVYTPYVVTWLLVFQRLHANASLADAVAEFLTAFPAAATPDVKRTRDGTLSANTGGHSRARSRLAPAAARAVADRIAGVLLAARPPSWRGRRVVLLDGTTLRLAPTAELRAAYPPAANQHGASHFPVLHLVAAHELESGLALRPEFGPMYGPAAASELALTLRLLPRLPAGCILLADRNFGVFAVAHAAAASGRAVLVRLSGPRFRQLRRQAAPAGPGSWSVLWRPSRWDRAGHPGLPADAAVPGWLHTVVLPTGEPLWLFTTVDASAAELAGLYRRRWDMEGDIRDIKQTLAMDRLAGRGAAMAEKELLLGVVAYNLVNQVRRLAAARAGAEPRRLSFAGTWSLVKAFLAALAAGLPAAEWERRFEAVLRWAGQRKLAERPGRSAPRTVLPNRRKFPTRSGTPPPERK